MFGSSFAKALIMVGLIQSLLSATAHGEGVAFTESGPLGTPAPGQTDLQATAIAQLKYQAISNYLAQYLGPRFAQFEKMISKDFGEKYILDYKVGKSSKDKTQIELVGHLDANGLKRWVRLMETKGKSNSGMTPVLVVSSSVPGYPLISWDTPIRLRDSAVAQSLQSSAGAVLQKFNIKLSVADLNGLTLREPPKGESDISNLKSAASHGGAHNSVLWMHVEPCKSCGGLRLDSFFYNLAQNRRVVARSDDLTLSPTDVGNVTKFKNAIKQPMAQLQTDIEEAFSSGAAFGSNYIVRIEGIENYASFKNIEDELTRLDCVLQLVPRAAEKNSASFKLLASVSVDELSQRLAQEPFPGFRLKPQSSDSRSLVMQYVK